MFFNGTEQIPFELQQKLNLATMSIFRRRQPLFERLSALYKILEEDRFIRKLTHIFCHSLPSSCISPIEYYIQRIIKSRFPISIGILILSISLYLIQIHMPIIAITDNSDQILKIEASFIDDFSSNLDKWVLIDGSWFIESNELCGKAATIKSIETFPHDRTVIARIN